MPRTGLRECVIAFYNLWNSAALRPIQKGAANHIGSLSHGTSSIFGEGLLEVFTDLVRVLRPAGLLVCTFSNRCFPTKAVRGWLATSDAEHCSIVAGYFERSGGWNPPVIERRTPPVHLGDPLFAVWATRAEEGVEGSR